MPTGNRAGGFSIDEFIKVQKSKNPSVGALRFFDSTHREVKRKNISYE